MTVKTELRIGEFISEKLSISKSQLRKFLNMQEYLNEKIGEIASQEGLVQPNELNQILDFQKKNHCNFGKAAISLGILKGVQVKYLLDIQTGNKHRIGELLVQKKIISEEDLFKLLDEFYSKKHIRFTILAYAQKEVCDEIKKAIKPYHYRFQFCDNEEKMISLIQELNPQLVILDKEMREDVLELALKMTKVSPSQKFKTALLSPKKKKLEILSGYKYGVDYILPIPFDKKNLINIMIDTENLVWKERKERILVVEDSPIVQKSIGEELEESGFQVFLADNGKEAVELASLEKPDLITMDINMPVMDGYQACLKMKNKPATSNIPIIIVTVNNTREERERGFEVGAVEYFTKPFPKGHLSNYIETLLSGHKEKRPEKILIAEESPICRNIYAAILDKYGFEFEMVENGKKVFEVLDKGFEPSVVLLDSMMPVMDGFQVCLKLKSSKEHSNIPVIMVTAAKNKEDILGGLKAGANDYILKPFDEDELIARMETHVKNFTLLKKIKKQNEELSALNKLKDEYLFVVSHDLRSPLSNIVGFAGLLENSKSFSESEIEMVKIIKSCAEHQIALVEDLFSLRNLDTSNPELEMSEIVFQELIEEAIKTNSFNFNLKKIKLAEEMPKEPIKILADRLKIFQVLNNLISNAIKFSNKGGEIKVKTVLKKEKARFSIQDHGVGIPKSNLEKIFHRFSDARRQGTMGELSTGLGLSITKKIVGLHRGEIWVDSEKGKGSTFSFTLPLDSTAHER